MRRSSVHFSDIPCGSLVGTKRSVEKKLASEIREPGSRLGTKADRVTIHDMPFQEMPRQTKFMIIHGVRGCLQSSNTSGLSPVSLLIQIRADSRVQVMGGGTSTEETTTACGVSEMQSKFAGTYSLPPGFHLLTASEKESP